MSFWPIAKPKPHVTTQMITNGAEWYRRTGIPVIKSSGAWSSANLAVYSPIVFREPMRIDGIGIYYGSAVSGNLCIGLYLPDADDLPGTRIYTSGSFAQVGATNLVTPGISGGLWVDRGLYYVACSVDNTTAEFARVVALTADGTGPNMGSIYTEASAFPLPATATPDVSGVAANVPIMGAYVV